MVAKQILDIETGKLLLKKSFRKKGWVVEKLTTTTNLEWQYWIDIFFQVKQNQKEDPWWHINNL